MLKNVRNGEDGLEGEVFFELFKKDIKIFTGKHKQDITTEYVEKCAGYLNSMSEETIDKLCEASIRYCNDSLDMIGEDKKKFNNRRDILTLIYPSILIIPSPKNWDEPVVHLELNCEWEEEHGMEWIVRNGKVLYVGSFNGGNPWFDYSKKQSWNFA